mmetsp:Transcript_52414/g.157261  ORF Transcript_52414/g.157261 Transcript_52414/m.157261 type:complete len:304 (-) Transcript_52414:512-1423(-)|eukprot:CAMPEP_0113545188 /NCGR_PEP_ID=MMETSP0015_2-20120614/11125_1 /TAXON_ID=2838 /ORGANISM="Odontella" /LENGTH=303 /DNA_ID=CAMNT_0000445531 /DNA_START=168 /DNA_END=1079 /DNA_ORIENTATION=- /assembly_acc=CAM_ASM_000160
MVRFQALALVAHFVASSSAFIVQPRACASGLRLQSQKSDAVNFEPIHEPSLFSSRRDLLRFSLASAMTAAILPISSFEANAATPDASILDDLPPDAARSYLQYRIPLQIAADFYIFELQDMVKNIDDWGEINQLARVNNNKGQGQPSRIERDFVNPMRILSLSFPPDTADEMREHQFRFEKAMAKLTKVTMGVRRDLPVEIDSSAIPTAKASWEEGRVALNDFFVALNDETGLKELKTIPSAGPAQFKEYGRSSLKYNDLMKKTKLCQNRGGPTLSNAWGKLMTTGYLQDSCGIPDLEIYFNQ